MSDLSSHVRRHKRLYFILGAILLLVWLVPRMARTYAEAYRIGSEIRESQGR